LEVKVLNQKSAILFLFFEGFAAIAIQFIVLRQVTPFVGSSVVVTSFVISIFLGALAVGYKKGGKIDKKHTEVLSRNLFKAATLLGILGSYMFLTVVYMYTEKTNPIFVLIVYLLVVMSPIVYYVAQTIPILVNSMEDKESSRKAGNALSFSTIGNMFGGVITTVVVMYYFGISWAVTITVFILFMLSLSISENKKKTLFYIFIIFPIILIINIKYSSLMHVSESIYSNYEVVKEKNATHLLINRSFSSQLRNKDRKPYKYIERIRDIIRSHPSYSKDAKILVIGAGGFTLNADKKLKGKILYVDIDNKIKDIAEKYFLKEPINGKFEGIDARVFLRRYKGYFDFIVVDAYFATFSVPENLTTIEFFKGVGKKLKPHGIMVSNFVENPYLNDTYSKRIDNTIRASFFSCYTSVIEHKNPIKNVIYTCSNDLNNKRKKTDLIYRDQNNQPSIDFINSRF